MRQYDFAKEVKILTLRETPLALGATICDNPEKIYEYWVNVIATNPSYVAEQENVFVLMLNVRKRVTGHILISLGTQDCVITHPREVFKAAIVASANSIILTHNHPSGDPNPSEADIKITREIKNAGELLKIPLIDHVIIGEKTPDTRGYSSLRELGYLW